jgi:hypothetical protein
MYFQNYPAYNNFTFDNLEFAIFGSCNTFYCTWNTDYYRCGYGIKVVGRLLAEDQNFYDCTTGIFATGYFDDIENCTFTGFRNYGVQLNIKPYPNGYSYAKINNNQFNSANNLPFEWGYTADGNTAIYVYGLTNTILRNDQLGIYENYITNTKNGIVLANLKHNLSDGPTQIHHNYIWMSIPKTLGTTHTAIKVLNCTNIGCGFNEIDREQTSNTINGLEELYAAGIFYSYSFQSIVGFDDISRHIFANTFYNINNSIKFRGTCLGVGVGCNQMHDAFQGVTIGGANEYADISSQLPYPSTNPNTSYTGNTWDDYNNADWHYRVYGNNAHQISWNTSDNWSTSQFGTGYPQVVHCTNVIPNYYLPSSIPSCIEHEMPHDDLSPFDLREYLIGPIVRDEINYDDGNEMLAQHAKEYAFYVLKDNSGQIPEEEDRDLQLYSGFMNEFQASNIGKFYELDSLINSDSLMSLAAIDIANSILNSIEPNSQYEDDKKYLYEFYLDNEVFNSVDAIDDDRVIEIAHSSSLDKAENVYIARAFTQEVIDEDNQEELRKSSKGKINSNSLLTVHLFPNLVKDYLMMDIEGLSKLDDNSLQLKLVDLSGRVVIERHIEYHETILPLQNIQSGIYLYRIEQNGMCVNAGKLVVEK